jgi:PE-PPE domain
VRAGVAALEDAMAKHPNDDLVIYGYSQGAIIANLVKRKLAEQYPAGTTAPDIDFVLSGDINLPNGGLASRFAGLYIPILDVSFNGPAPTGTQFDTVDINRQYDGFADFPLYPLNAISLFNALLGTLYVHSYDLEVSLADPTTSPPIKSQHGDTTYYFFETQDLPLFGPLRTLGVPESLIDVVEPFFRVLVDLGYDRSIPPWEPTPARLIPPLHPATVAVDLLAAIGEGINNAFALFGSPVPLRSPAPVTLAAPATETATADISPQVMSIATPTQTEQAMATGAAIRTQQMSTDIAPSTTKVTETANADGFPQVTPTETVTETGDETSGKKSTETATANEAPAGPTAASAPEPSASASISEPVKPTVRSATLRPVVRSSLTVGEQLGDRPHRGNSGRPSTWAALSSTAAAGPSSVASSPADSSPVGSNSAGGDSSGGDADD